MNSTEAVKEVLEAMRDSIGDEICRAFIEIEQLGVPEADVEDLLADQVLDIIMDKFAEHFPELHQRATAMYAAIGSEAPSPAELSRPDSR